MPIAAGDVPQQPRGLEPRLGPPVGNGSTALATDCGLQWSPDQQKILTHPHFVKASLGQFSAPERCKTGQLGMSLHTKLALLMDEAEADVLAFMSSPKAHCTQIHSTNPLERLNAEVKRRTDVVGIFPNEAAITRHAGALLLEQNDEWQLQRRYMALEPLRALIDNQPARLSAVVS